MIELIKYDAARRALQEAHSIDEVKAIRDKAEAMWAYARQAKDVEFQNWAAEIRLRAERRAGELLRETEKRQPGPLNQDQSSTTTDLPPKITDLGISRDQSAQGSTHHRQRTTGEVLHLPADVLRRSLAEKTGPIKPSIGPKNLAQFSPLRGFRCSLDA
jgi:hypothetical protein